MIKKSKFSDPCNGIVRAKQKVYYAANKDKMKAYCVKNKDRILEQVKNSYWKLKEQIHD